jgi:hypothetical protein
VLGEDGGHERRETTAADERAEDGIEVRGGGRLDGGEQRRGTVTEADRGEGRERDEGVDGKSSARNASILSRLPAQARRRRWAIGTVCSVFASAAAVETRRQPAEKTAVGMAAGVWRSGGPDGSELVLVRV